MIKVYHLHGTKSQMLGGIKVAIEGIRSLSSFGRIELVDNIDEADVVHIHGLWNSRNTIIAIKMSLKGKPFIVSPHGMLQKWALKHKRLKKKIYMSFLEKWLLKGASLLISTSKIETNDCIGFNRKFRVVEIPLGIHPPTLEIRPRSSKKIKFLFFSRIHEVKGLDVLLRGLILASKKIKDRIELSIIGDGEASYVEEIRRLIEENRANLPAITVLKGVWGEEKWKKYLENDYFILPSKTENFGLVYLEALCSGRRIICSENTPWAGYKKKFIKVIKVRESDIIAVINEVVNDSPLILQESKEIRSWAIENFSWEKLEDRYYKMYNSVKNRNNK